MRSRRFIGFIVSILLIIAILLVFSDQWNTGRNKGKGIILKDAREVDRISLSDPYDTTILIREGDEWLLFGQEPVNEVAMENLIFAAERIQIISTVSSALVPDSAPARKVVFFQGERAVLSYNFFSRGDRYVIRKTGSDISCYVTIPGFSELNLDRVFSNSANHYREHILIDLLPSDISRIAVKIGKGEAFCFTQDEDGELTCSVVHQDTPVPSDLLDDLSIRLLLSYFTSIRYEQRSGIPVDQLTGAGEVNRRIATLQVESHKGEKHTLQVFPYMDEPGKEAHMFRALVAYNDDPEALLVNYIYLDVLMREMSHYFAGNE